MLDIEGQLTVLQHGDSFFPSGAVGFSYGLETLAHDGLVRDAREVESFVNDQIRHRWASLDRSILCAAWRSANDVPALVKVDELQEALTLPRELREGSRRCGAALLSVHRQLGTPGATDLSEQLAVGEFHAHLNVIQGVVWRGSGLALAEAQLLGAHTLCVAMLGAALRLGIIGHLGAQTLLGGLRSGIAEVLEAPIPELDRVNAYTPLGEIAVMRHEDQQSRLFSN